MVKDWLEAVYCTVRYYVDPRFRRQVKMYRNMIERSMAGAWCTCYWKIGDDGQAGGQAGELDGVGHVKGCPAWETGSPAYSRQPAPRQAAVDDHPPPALTPCT